ncbi:MFS transporter, partial [Halobacterium sp. PCN9]|nr:MFS transporter [Halobacterium bonnevillei]
RGVRAVLVLPAFVAMRPMGAVVRTVRSRYLNDRIESVGRATAMSAASLVFSVVRFPLLLGAGVVADAFGPYVALSAVNAAFVGCAAVLWVVETPIRAGHDTGVVPAD